MSIPSDPGSHKDLLTRAIEQAITEAIVTAMNKEIEAAKERLETAIRSHVDEIACKVAKHYSIENCRNEIIIRVSKEI